MRSSPPQVGGFTVFLPPPSITIEIHDVIEALQFAVESDEFGPYGVLVAWLDADRRLLGCLATDVDQPDLTDLVVLPSLIELGRAIDADAAVVFSPVRASRARQVHEDDLRKGRALVERSALPVLDWILIAPDDLRSMAVTAGWAQPAWDRDPPVGGVG